MDKLIINLLDKIISKREIRLSRKYNILSKEEIDNCEIELYRNLLNCIDKYNANIHEKFALRHYRYLEFELDEKDIDFNIYSKIGDGLNYEK